MNDNAPEISNQTFSIAENLKEKPKGDMTVGTTVGTIMASDADGDKLTFVDQGTLVNRMLSANGVIVDGDTGKITTADDLTKFYSSGFDTVLFFDVMDGKFRTTGGQVTINFQ